MNTGNWIVLTTSTIAALVAVVGYLLNQHAARNERRSRSYAAALEAVYAYQELPFRIRRRTSDPKSSMELAQKISDAFERLSFYQAWMDLESPWSAGPFRTWFSERTDNGCPTASTPGGNLHHPSLTSFRFLTGDNTSLTISQSVSYAFLL